MVPNIISSPLGPLPAPPETNFVYTLLHAPSPPRPELPGDYVTHIDGITGKRRTFQQCIARINEVGAAFCAPNDQGGLGLQPGKDVVGLLSNNCIDYPVVVLALLQNTLPLALLNSHSTAPELVHQLKLTGISHLIVGPTSMPVVKRALKLAGMADISLTVLEGCGAKAHSSEVSLQQLIDRTRERGIQPASIIPAERDTLAYLVFSSGTSGLPKVHTQYPVYLAFLPMYHSMGLHLYNFRFFVSPTTLVVLPSWNTETVLRCIRKYRVTNLALVPSLVFQLLAYPKLKFEGTDLSSLVGIAVGAAYLPPATEKEFLDLVEAKGSKGSRVNLTNGYGLSEVTLAVCTRPADGMLGGKIKSEFGSVGVLLPGIEVRFCHEAPPGTPVEDLVDVAPGEPGELYVRGPNNALGYWKNEKATRETFLPGNWMRTGDRDTLKVSGVQVSPTEIETVLKAHPNAYLMEACVAGVPGPRDDGELVPKAWVVLSAAGCKAGVKKVTADLHEWVQGQLSKPKHLRGGIETVKSIPKNPTGKVLRRVLRDKHGKSRGGVKAKL
ncbi:hypothetical protein FRC10_010798 [Ceratobasidium sp. 414]|nr:hypothetical protein FRC10_010798 [Ceratobasidium sp. 414]